MNRSSEYRRQGDRGALGMGPPTVHAITQSRITIVETVSFQPLSSEAVSFQNSSSKILDTEEQPFVRKAKLGPDWAKVEKGWIQRASLMLLTNEEGKTFQVQPSAEQLEEVSSRIIEVFFGSQPYPDTAPHCLVFPTMSLRITPNDIDSVFVRCKGVGGAKYTLLLTPF